MIWPRGRNRSILAPMKNLSSSINLGVIAVQINFIPRIVFRLNISRYNDLPTSNCSSARFLIDWGRSINFFSNDCLMWYFIDAHNDFNKLWLFLVNFLLPILLPRRWTFVFQYFTSSYETIDQANENRMMNKFQVVMVVLFFFFTRWKLRILY